MSEDDTNDYPTHHHFYITPEVLPKPDDSIEEWARRTTMLAEMVEQLARSTHTLLQMYAPVLTSDDQPFTHMLAGIGLVCLGIAATGRAQLDKTGTTPLTVQDDQLRIIRDQLAKPGIDPELRDALLAILAHNLETPDQPTEPTDFPEGGFVIGGE